MDSVINAVSDWVFASPLERLLLCAETIAIMIGGPLAWWNRLTLKSYMKTLQSNVKTLVEEEKDDRADYQADMQRKYDELLGMMRKMVGQSEEKQKKILEVARESVMESTATVNKRAPRSDSKGISSLQSQK